MAEVEGAEAQLNALGLPFRREHYSFTKYLLSAYFVLSIVLGTENISLMNRLKSLPSGSLI